MCMCGLLKLTKAVFRHDIHDVMPGDTAFAVIRIPSAKGPLLMACSFYNCSMFRFSASGSSVILLSLLNIIVERDAGS